MKTDDHDNSLCYQSSHKLNHLSCNLRNHSRQVDSSNFSPGVLTLPASSAECPFNMFKYGRRVVLRMFTQCVVVF